MAVKFQLYEVNGTTLIYTFPVVFSSNLYHGIEKEFIEYKNLRGKGEIVADGGELATDRFIRGVISGTDYDDLQTNLDEIETAIVLNTPYVLKITQKDGVTTQYSFKVKRLTPIITPDDSLRNDNVEYIINMKVNAF
jgi:hypothetical protein